MEVRALMCRGGDARTAVQAAAAAAGREQGAGCAAAPPRLTEPRARFSLVGDGMAAAAAACCHELSVLGNRLSLARGLHAAVARRLSWLALVRC